jgi:hypothetical protein
MDIEPVIESYHEQAYDEVTEHQYVTELVVSDGDTGRAIPSRSNGEFEHINGFLLTVDVEMLFNEPSISVETAHESVNDGWNYQRWSFNSFEALESWLSSNASLV